MGTTTTSKYNDDDDNNDGDYNDSTTGDSGNHSNWKDVIWTQDTIITSTTSRDIHEKRYSDRAVSVRQNTKFITLFMLLSELVLLRRAFQWRNHVKG